ncbi:MAG: PEP-CTERM sorting domain-containing protein [Leptolyngbya sp. SIO3F4]|nr:PEP-CTERM sorting domain-containing protein [Leptolyngbya sp. SIO3F4]
MKQLAVFTGSIVCSFVVACAANAGTFHQGWTYSIDSLDDGSGGTAYEIEGLAVKETADYVYISVAGGAALTGIETDAAVDGNIGWGDLLLNFTGTDLNDANGDLWGVRFAATNDSGVSDVGLFRDVTANSVAQINNGYGSLGEYYRSGYGRDNTLGDIATEASAFDYIDSQTPVLSSIDSGTWVGTIDFLSDQDAAMVGLDFTHFNIGINQTHTFRFDRALMPDGDFIASLFLECVNDGVALLSSLTVGLGEPSQDVPEPSIILGVIGLGVLAKQTLDRT